MLMVMMTLAATAPLHAQSPDRPDDGGPELGKRASFMSGASFGDGDTALALSAGLGFAFSPRWGLDFEIAYARKLDFVLDVCPSPLVCIWGGQIPVTGRTVSLVPHLVFELLPASGRFRVYAQAGAGAGHVRQRYFFGPPFVQTGAEPTEFTRSRAIAAASFGGGAAVRLTRRLAVGADVRSLHLFDEEATLDRFIMPSGRLGTLRIGSRVSWEF
jgi:opacity protein-like surface antigen